MASTLNPDAPEFRPAPPRPPSAAATIPQYYVPPPPPQHFWFNPEPFVYLPQQELLSPFYSNYAMPVYAAAPLAAEPVATNPSRPPRPLLEVSNNQPHRPPGGRRYQNRGFPRRHREGCGGGRDSRRYNNNGGEGLRRDDRVSRRVIEREGNRRPPPHRVIMTLELAEDHTTVLIKNIPYHCSREELINFLDGFCSKKNAEARNDLVSPSPQNPADDLNSAYDFLYLPIDFLSKRSRGFGFVNFTNPITARKFFEYYNNRPWDSVHSGHGTKTMVIASAQLQGREALVEHFAVSIFYCEMDEYLPVCFDPARNGSGQAVVQTVVGRRINAICKS